MKTTSEQEWYKKFQEGSFMAKGWKDRINEILKSVPPANKDEIRTSLFRLGEKIGWEWSKDNTIRKIDTPMLQKWGEELRLATKKSFPNLLETIRSIETNVDQVLS